MFVWGQVGYGRVIHSGGRQSSILCCASRGAKTESRRKSVCVKNKKVLRVTQHSERENHILRFVCSNYTDKETASWTITAVETWGQK